MTEEQPITPPPELVEQWRIAPEYTSALEKVTMVTMTERRLQEIATKATNWQLGRVLEWIKNCKDYDLFYTKDRALMRRELKKAMRPQQIVTEPKIIYNPVTIAECGGPCEQGPEYCDCGELRIDSPPTSYSEPTTNLREGNTMTDDFHYDKSSTEFFSVGHWDNGKFQGTRELDTDGKLVKLLKYVQQLERRIEELEFN